MAKDKLKRSTVVVNPLGEIYTTDQVAEILHVHVRTVLRAIEQGRLKARKIGKGYRITREALEEYFRGSPERLPP